MPSPTDRRRPLKLAHRGDWRRAPENTIEALVAAAAIPGCDGIEFDVQASADGVPILLHDDTLQRVQARPERPDELTAAELEDLGVPSLADALAALPHRTFLDVELKGDPGRAVVEVLAAARGAELHDAVVSSFDPRALERVAGLAPAWPRWLNAEDLSPATIAVATDLGCTAISVDWHAIDAGALRRMAAAELDVAAWTVTRRPTYARLARLGVVAICVEGPALIG